MNRVLLICPCVICMSVTPRASGAELAAVSRLTLGPGSTLFAADWKAGSVYAFELPSSEPEDGKLFNLRDAEKAIRAAIQTSDFEVEDLVMRPQSNEAYVAVETLPDRQPVILMVKADGKFRRLHLDDLPATSVNLQDLPSKSLVLWDHIPGRCFTVTDMRWYNGKLYVAGLSNQPRRYLYAVIRILIIPEWNQYKVGNFDGCRCFAAAPRRCIYQH